jgi:leader peptidase (prepilin peptidase)/N-methyltransferase
VLVFYLYGWNSIPSIFISITYCLLISALIVLSVIDFRTNIIPIGINIFILILGLITVAVKYIGNGHSLELVMNHGIGFFAVSAFLLIIFCATHGKGIGGGDIKLMAVAGLLLGWELIILSFFIGCVLAAIIHPIRMKINHLNRILAFGPYLSVGITVALLFGNEMITWYLKQL